MSDSPSPAATQDKGAEVISLQERRDAVTGGKEPPDDNWLARIEPGTFFLITKRTDRDPLEGCEVYMRGKITNWAYLVFNMPDKSFPMWVNLQKYSKEYKLEEIIRLPIELPLDTLLGGETKEEVEQKGEED